MWVDNNRLYERYKGLDGRMHKASVLIARDTPQGHKMARIALENKIAGILSPACEKRLNDAVNDYLARKNDNVKTSTIVNYRNAFAQILDILGDVPVASLTAPYIKRKFTECPKPISAKNRYIELFNAFLGWLFEYGYLETQIKISLEKDRKQLRDSGDLYLEPDELRNVLDDMAGTMSGYVCRFMALTGCRIGEAVALRLDDIGPKYIRITKTYDEHNGILNDTPKTATSKRDIYIQPELRAMLRDFYEWRSLFMLAHGVRSDLLFFSQVGGYFCVATLRNRLHAINKKLHPHIFRHTHVALLAEQGASLETIARRLGHSDSRITRQVYFHVTERMRERDESVLDGIALL